jgi:hypothetical protein
MQVLVSVTEDIKIARPMMDTLNILSPSLTLDDATKNTGNHFVMRWEADMLRKNEEEEIWEMMLNCQMKTMQITYIRK